MSEEMHGKNFFTDILSCPKSLCFINRVIMFCNVEGYLPLVVELGGHLFNSGSGGRGRRTFVQ